TLAMQLKPYRDSIDLTMNEVVGSLQGELVKKSPEGSLGNFMADAVLFGAQQKFRKKVDAAFVNSGGVRLTQIPKGAITRGKIFELMPFDNIIVLQQVKGEVFQQFLDATAEKGGWPLSGLTMEIRNGKARNIIVGGAPLDPAKMYTIANSDYVVNGGDDAVVLKNIPQEANGYLMRDAILDYLQSLKASGKTISTQEEKRVVNVQ
ncbi:MAG TPA: 5'-nucleotidase C-terminal domain-containing protein, partial [Flavisolibacter sp.]|nr:5'-nucleotidase C-terminal domain-containing protein [Flavisolibacter sp.]